MKIKSVIVLTFIICSSTNADTSRNIEEALQEKCDRNTDIKNAANKFREAFGDIPNCFRTAFSEEPPHPVKKYDDFCRYLRNNISLYACLENSTKKISPCLDQPETYLPPLILNAYNSSLETLCGPDGVSNTEYLYNKIENPCFSNATNLLRYQGTCITDLTQYRHLGDGIIDFNKRDLCLDIELLLRCTTKVLDETCKEDYSIALRLIFKPLLDACNDASQYN